MNDLRLCVIAGADEEAQDLLKRLETASIEIVISDPQPSWQQQALAVTLADLLGRLFARVTFEVVPDATADPQLEVVPLPVELGWRSS